MVSFRRTSDDVIDNHSVNLSSASAAGSKNDRLKIILPASKSPGSYLAQIKIMSLAKNGMSDGRPNGLFIYWSTL